MADDPPLLGLLRRENYAPVNRAICAGVRVRRCHSAWRNRRSPPRHRTSRSMVLLFRYRRDLYLGLARPARTLPGLPPPDAPAPPHRRSRPDSARNRRPGSNVPARPRLYLHHRFRARRGTVGPLDGIPLESLTTPPCPSAPE